jgi:16S rRNA processing protein RimM
MNRDDFYYLGKIKKTSGYKGNLVFFFDVDDISYYKELEAVFVKINEELIPFAINSLQIKDNKSAFVKLEDIDSEDQAAVLTGQELYLPLSFLPPLSGNKFYYHEVIGFDVVDITNGNIGKIESFIEQAAQALFIIKYNEKEILIPVADNIIKKVDRINRIIEIEAPSGLIDIYL